MFHHCSLIVPPLLRTEMISNQNWNLQYSFVAELKTYVSQSHSKFVYFTSVYRIIKFGVLSQP